MQIFMAVNANQLTIYVPLLLLSAHLASLTIFTFLIKFNFISMIINVP